MLLTAQYNAFNIYILHVNSKQYFCTVLVVCVCVCVWG